MLGGNGRMKQPVIMTEEVWMNSMLSIARIYGGMTYNGKQYLIVNKEGATLEELSNPHSKYYVGDGDVKAIPPGEPADLVMKEWVPIYKALGRDKVMELAKKGTPLVEALKIVKDLKTRTLKPKKKLIL